MAQPDLSCPFINRDDPRCDARFTLARLNEAFSICAGPGFLSCPTYRQLVRQQQPHDAHAYTIHITVEGRFPVPRPAKRLAV